MFVPISFVVLGFMEYAEITDMMMMMRETPNYCLCLNPFEKRCRVNEKKVGLSKPHFLCLRAMGKGEGRGRAATPSRHPDTRAAQTPRHPEPPRHPDTPTPQGWRCKCKPNARGMRGDSARGMRGECEGNATAKARGEGVGARGEQRRRGKKPKGAKSKPLALLLGGLVL